ncbi:MAG: flap endonuclease [Chloroflexi bacterium]|nr:flap endonuclease [Chloroflexota bacterium]
MKVHLVDGTYELFRVHFGAFPAVAPDGRSVGAVRGLLQTLLALLSQDDVTHVAVAFDHVIVSFRNDLFDGYKTGEGTSEELLAQFDLAEIATEALGIVTWPMVEYEADDAIATAAVRFADDPQVEQVVICSPDKDLMQVVRGDKIVSLDRRREILTNEAGVVEKFGVPPESIADYLALVGDSADGIPGVPRWGAKSASTLLARYGNIEAIPDSEMLWDVKVRGAKSMAGTLAEHRADAALYKELATLRLDVPLSESLDDLEWKGARRTAFSDLCDELGFGQIRSAPTIWTE